MPVVRLKSRRSGVDLRDVVNEMFGKPPKRWRSWRVCPRCGSKASKILSINTGKYTCQVCDHQYDPPAKR